MRLIFPESPTTCFPGAYSCPEAGCPIRVWVCKACYDKGLVVHIGMLILPTSSAYSTSLMRQVPSPPPPIPPSPPPSIICNKAPWFSFATHFARLKINFYEPISGNLSYFPDSNGGAPLDIRRRCSGMQTPGGRGTLMCWNLGLPDNPLPKTNVVAAAICEAAIFLLQPGTFSVVLVGEWAGI